MRLWTIQPKAVYDLICETGVYRCDFSKTEASYWKEPYDFMVDYMAKSIGKPPKGVTYPVWARYIWNGKRQKPDLRTERWNMGEQGDKYVCMEIEIPDNEVVLSDLDAWSITLNNGLISYTKKEDEEIESAYEKLSDEKKKEFRHKNWKRAFDITPRDNGWMSCGDFIQATFWELKKEQIINVRHFITMQRKYEKR